MRRYGGGCGDYQGVLWWALLKAPVVGSPWLSCWALVGSRASFCQFSWWAFEGSQVGLLGGPHGRSCGVMGPREVQEAGQQAGPE